MTLADWLAKGWLTDHRTSPREIADLLALCERDLEASHAEGLPADWRLSIAHNAALQAATMALAACGYRATRLGHHYRVIQSLPLTIGADPSLVQQLDAYRRKRNQSAYERAGIASDWEADELITLAEALRDDVLAWLRHTHPELTAELSPS